MDDNNASEDIPGKPNFEYELSTEHMIYYDDYLLRLVLKNIDALDRKNVELTSRRMYYVSTRTAYHARSNLQVNINFLATLLGNVGNKEMSARVCRKNVINDEMEDTNVQQTIRFITSEEFLSGLPIQWDLNDISLKKINYFCKKSIRALYIGRHVDDVFLKLIEESLPNLTNLQCFGFSKSALEYLYSADQRIASKITKLSVLMKEWEESDFLRAFRNLKKIHFINTVAQVNNELRYFNGKFKKLSVCISRLDDLNLLSQKCHHLKVQHEFDRFGSSSKPPTFDVDNLYTLYLSFVENNTVLRFFESYTFKNIRKLRICSQQYTDKFVEAIAPRLSVSTTVTQLTFFGWAGQFSCLTVPMTTVLPSSLKKLKIVDVILTAEDLGNIPKKCPDLEYLSLALTKQLFDQKEFSQMLKSLKNLKGCVVRSLENQELMNELFPIEY